MNALDDERWAAVQRLNTDLHTADGRDALAALRRRCVAVYRTALSEAAGVPHERVWADLSRSVAAFVSAIADRATLDPARQAAVRRLRTLASD